MAYKFPHQHLLGIQGLTQKEISSILTLAETNIERNRQTNKKHAILKGRTLINLFFENSTRTRSSFELAGKRMGADVINMSASGSAVSKGETLLDTAMTLNAMHPDFITIRHSESGAAHLIAQKVNCRVINAGDGCHEHPTQALLDALTIQRRIGKLKGLKIAICGDILHSRVAHSNMYLLKTMGATVSVISPPTLVSSHIKNQYGIKIFHTMEEGLKGANVVMVLRLQQERMNGAFIPSIAEYFRFYGLDYEKLSYAAKDALVMDPGPIRRGIGIDSELADDINRSVILDQVEMGVAVRQAVLEMMA